MPGNLEHHSHFMLRVRRGMAEPAGAPADLEGLVEHLGTGEKRPFASGAELLRLVASWCGRSAGTLPVPEP